MADDDSNQPVGIRRQLPPLLGTGQQVNNSTENDSNPKPRRKKKKSAAPTDDGEDADKLATEVKEDDHDEMDKKSRIRRKRQPKEQSDLDTANDTELEGTGAVIKERKRRKPKEASGEIAEVEGDVEGKGVVKKQDRKKSPRRARVKDPNGSQNSLLSGADQVEGATPRKTKKKRVKKKDEKEETFNENIGLAAELADLKDDIIVDKPKATDDEDEEEETEETKAHTTAGALKSQPVGRLFIEERGGFRSENKAKLLQKREEMQAKWDEEGAYSPKTTTLSFALKNHKAILTFSLFCHGVLAGFALWHCIMVFVLSTNFDYIDFLKHYQPVALPTQSLYYLLFIICTVSAFDRYDIGRPTRLFIIRVVTLQNGAISGLVYFITMLLSLSIAAIDDKINLYGSQNNTQLWQSKQESEDTLRTWRIINTLRAAGAILGWIILSIQPVHDRLRKNLQMTEDVIGHSDNKKVMISAA